MPTVVVNDLTLAGSPETLTVCIGDCVLAATLTLAGSAETATIVPGPITVTVNALTLAGSAESTTVCIGNCVLAATLTLAGSAQTFDLVLDIANPTTIGDNELWLDASDVSTLWQDSGGTVAVTANGQTVGRWDDKSGNSNNATQTSSTREPTYETNAINSLSVLHMDGSNDYMDTGAITELDTDQLTAFIVMKSDVVNDTHIVLSSSYSSGASSNSNRLWGFGVALGVVESFFRATAGTFLRAQGPLAVVNVTQVTLSSASDDTTTCYVMGAGGVSVSGTTASPSGHGFTRIGARSSTAGSYFDGEVAEVVIYSRTLSKAERRAVESYLTQKWGMEHMPSQGPTTLYTGSGGTDWLGAPTLTVMSNGNWVMVYRQGSTQNFDGSAVAHMRFSTDEGRTWGAVDTFVDGVGLSDFPVSGHTSFGVHGLSIHEAPNGDLLLMVQEEGSSAHNGIYQWRSTDDGENWTDEGQINSDADLVSPGQMITVSSDMYWTPQNDPTPSGSPFKTQIYKSTNDGTTWTSVSDITSTTEDTDQGGIVHLGGNDFLVVLRQDTTDTFIRSSDDLGATWGTLTSVENQIGLVHRPRLYLVGTRVWLTGKTYEDFNERGFPTFLFSDDQGTTWSSGHVLDDFIETIGYMDWRTRANGEIVVLSHSGSPSNADIVEYTLRSLPASKVTLSTITLAGSAETITAAAPITISANELTLAGSAVSSTVLQTVPMLSATLVGTAPSLTVLAAEIVVMAALILAGSAEQINVMEGEFVTVNSLTLASSAETVFITQLIIAASLLLSSVIVPITIVTGATSVIVNALTLAGSAPLVLVTTDLVSSTDLALLRGDHHEHKVYVSALVPSDLWSARINDGSMGRSIQTIAFDGGSGSNFALVEALQEVWIGTTAGAQDIGRARIRSISSGDSGVTGTLVVAQHPWPLLDDHYLTFKFDYPIRPLFPLVTSDVFQKDKNVAYGDQNEKPVPVVIAGPHRADFLGSGGSTVFNVDATQSYAIADGATISSHALTVSPAAGAAVSFSSGSGTITFSTTGQWWAKYSVTDSNGKTQDSYRCYFIHSTSPENADYPLDSLYDLRLNGNWKRGGWNAFFSAHEKATLADIPKDTLTVIWSVDKYNNTETSITLLPNQTKTIFAGYVFRTVAHTDLSEDNKRVDFYLNTVNDVMRRFNFEVELETVEGVPSDWYQYEDWLTIGRGIHHLWKYHSTIFEVADVIGLRDNTMARAYAQFNVGNLYRMANSFAQFSGIRAHLVCDKGGRVHLIHDLQLLTDGERPQRSLIFDLTGDDRRGDIGLGNTAINKNAFVKVSGFAWDGSFRTDSSGNRVPDPDPFCASAPGAIPDDEGANVFTFGRQTFTSQNHANEIAGRVFAQRNNEFSNIPVIMHGNYVGVMDVAYEKWYTTSLVAGDTARATVWTDQRLACRTVSIQYDEARGTMLLQAGFEAEKQAVVGVTAVCPSFVPDPGGTTPEIPTESTLPDALMTGGSVYFKSAISQSWSLRVSASVSDLVEDPFWRTKVGSSSSNSAIIFRCGVGYIRRTTDAFQAVDVDVTPAIDPPNAAGDLPAPTVADVTFIEGAGSFITQNAFVFLARWQNPDGDWRSWLAYTGDNGTTWSWKAVGVTGTETVTSFGPATLVHEDQGDLEEMGSFTQAQGLKTVCVLSPTTVVAMWVNTDVSLRLQATVINIDGETLTHGLDYQLSETADVNTPRSHETIAIDSTRFLSVWSYFDGSDWHIKARIGTVFSTDIIAFGSIIDFSTGTDQAYMVALGRMDAEATLLAWNEDDQDVRVRTIFTQGTTPTLGQAYTIASSPNGGYADLSAVGLTSTRGVIAYRTAPLVPDEGKVIAVDRNGQELQFNTALTFSDDITESINRMMMERVDDTRFLLSWAERDVGFNEFGYARIGDITGPHGIAVTTLYAIAPWRTPARSITETNISVINSNYFVVSYFYTFDTGDTKFRIGKINPSTNVITYSSIVENTVETPGSEWLVQALSSTQGIQVREFSGAGPNQDLNAYIVNWNLEDYEALGLGLSVGKGSLDEIWVTANVGGTLYLLAYDLPGLVSTVSSGLGAATFAETISNTYVCYPAPLFGFDDTIYVFGRMKDPDSLGDPSHIIKTIDAGTNYTLIEGGWGASHCGALVVEPSGIISAIENLSSLAKLHTGTDAALFLESVLTFPTIVQPHAFDIDVFTGAVYACASVGNSIMVLKSNPPYQVWENITFDHGTSSGINSILLL